MKGVQYNKRPIFPPDREAARRTEEEWQIGTAGIRQITVLKGLLPLPDGILIDSMHSVFLGAFKHQIEAMFTYSVAAYYFHAIIYHSKKI